MSGCPVHIWGPMMAAALPFSRTIRDTVRVKVNDLLHRAPEEPAAPRVMKRWAPIAPGLQPEDPSSRS